MKDDPSPWMCSSVRAAAAGGDLCGCPRGAESLRVLLERLGLVSASSSAEPARAPPRGEE